MGDYLTSELAKLAGIKPQTVRLHLCRGELRHGKRRGPQGQRIISESAARRWLALHYPHKELPPVKSPGSGQIGPIWMLPAISGIGEAMHLVFPGGRTACKCTAREWRPVTDPDVAKCTHCRGAEKVLLLAAGA